MYSLINADVQEAEVVCFQCRENTVLQIGFRLALRLAVRSQK